MTDITIKNVCKSFQIGKIRKHVLSDISVKFEGRRFYCISGPSGSGKSTLLNTIAGLEIPEQGEVLYDGKNIYNFNEKEMDGFRRKTLGFVFQFYNLIPNLNLKENIQLSSDLVKDPLAIDEIIEFVGLAQKKKQYPDTLSGGEQQRVSIARAIIKNPDVILCDEPTGALDSKSGTMILELLRSLCNEFGKTVIVVTHNSSIVKMADIMINLKDSKIESCIENKHPISPKEVKW